MGFIRSGCRPGRSHTVVGSTDHKLQVCKKYRQTCAFLGRMPLTRELFAVGLLTFFFQIEDNTHIRTARVADGVFDSLPRFVAAATERHRSIGHAAAFLRTVGVDAPFGRVRACHRRRRDVQDNLDLNSGVIGDGSQAYDSHSKFAL